MPRRGRRAATLRKNACLCGRKKYSWASWYSVTVCIEGHQSRSGVVSMALRYSADCRTRLRAVGLETYGTLGESCPWIKD